jgi:AraC-like DNA-binding protein
MAAIIYSMSSMMLQIRNMKSNRCKAIVIEELVKLGLRYKYVELGEVELKRDAPLEKLQLIDAALQKSGLELIVHISSQLIEKIKGSIIQFINSSDELRRSSLSEYISKRVNFDYNYLSNKFSGSEGMTIEEYLINQRIEEVKKLLVSDTLSLCNIAYRLHYSGVAHLSNQFKKITGSTPSKYRQHYHNSCINPL